MAHVNAYKGFMVMIVLTIVELAAQVVKQGINVTHVTLLSIL